MVVKLWKWTKHTLIQCTSLCPKHLAIEWPRWMSYPDLWGLLFFFLLHCSSFSCLSHFWQYFQTEGNSLMVCWSLSCLLLNIGLLSVHMPMTLDRVLDCGNWSKKHLTCMALEGQHIFWSLPNTNIKNATNGMSTYLPQKKPPLYMF